MNNKQILENNLKAFKKQIETSKDLYLKKKKVKDDFEQKELNILLNTDFNEIYGKNNEKIRKMHIKNELKEEYDLLKQLECDWLESERLCDYYKAKLTGTITLLQK